MVDDITDNICLFSAPAASVPIRDGFGCLPDSRGALRRGAEACKVGERKGRKISLLTVKADSSEIDLKREQGVLYFSVSIRTGLIGARLKWRLYLKCKTLMQSSVMLHLLTFFSPLVDLSFYSALVLAFCK